MGWFILVYLGLEGLGVFVVLVCVFFCSGFAVVCSGFVVFVFLLDCCWCSCFFGGLCVFDCFLFFWLEGLRVK